MESRVFELIVNEHKDMLYVYLLALVRDQALAEDITQETFLAAYEALTMRGTEVHSVPGWLRGIGRNLAAEALEKKKREPALMPDASAVEGIMEPFDEFALGDLWRERLEALRECRERLPDHQKRAVEFHYGEDLRAPAIAEKTGWVVATVYQILWEARESLRNCIERVLAQEGQTA